MLSPDQNQDDAAVSPSEPQTPHASPLAPAFVAEQPEPSISLVSPSSSALFGALASATPRVPYVAPSAPSSSQTPPSSYVPTSPQIPSISSSAPSSSFAPRLPEEFLRSCPQGELRRISGLWDTNPVEGALSALRLVHQASGAQGHQVVVFTSSPEEQASRPGPGFQRGR